MLRTATRLAAFGSFVLAFLSAAGALAAPDAHAVADALVEASNASGKATASYADATASGDTVTITGFKAVEPKATGRTVTVATVTLTGVAPRQPGGFTAASMTFADGSANYRQQVVKWQSAVVTNAVIPSADEVKSISNKVQPFSSASVSGITISDADLEQPIDIAKVDVTMAADANGEPNGVAFTATGVHLSVTSFKAPEDRAMMQGLGYTDLVASIKFDAGFDSKADTFTLRSLDFDVANVGKLDVTGKFSNVKVHGMINTGTSANPAPKQEPSLDGLTVRFDNAGVIERALDMQAQILGTTRQDVAAQWPMLVMFMVGDAGGADFQQKVQTALTTFLQSPKSLTVSLAPSAPVPFKTVAETLSKDQTKLPELLAVDISVNK